MSVLTIKKPDKGPGLFILNKMLRKLIFDPKQAYFFS